MSRSKAECVDYVPKTCVFEATEDPFEFSFQASAKCAKVNDSKNTCVMTHMRLRLPIESGKAVNVDTDSVNEAEDQHISGLRLLSADFHDDWL